MATTISQERVTLKRWIFRLIAMALASLAAAIVYAPYLPRLLWEGYPQATWPAPGTYATVAGGDGLAPETPARMAMPDAGLKALFDGTEGRALLAARDGKLVLEHYASGITRDTRLNSYSLVKSLVAALTLKAVADGRIARLDLPLGSVLTELSGKDIGQLPLCRFFDMKSGIQFEPGGKKQASGFDVKDLEATKLNLLGPMGRLHMRGLASVADRLTGSAEGSDTARGCAGGTYSYQNVNTALLGEVLERAYATPLQDILGRNIWTPAGAAPAEWRRYGEGLPVTPYCCLFARPLDWLKVAQFLLDNGTKEKPFLPTPLWRQLMGSDLTPADLRDGHYTLHTYHNILDRPGEALAGPFAYFFGSRGQAVYLMPGARLAVVRFGGRVQLLHSTLYGVGRSLAAGP